uniref:Uncharacterized protein n=1 Tax=Erpetoichthys calabaricus TaxID=27687 RepID=A0A8C4SJP7_ERPCA
MSSSDDDTLSERSCLSERSYRSERSGSLSPCIPGPLGDTLPWNLARHERHKRQSQESVLDPAERASSCFKQVENSVHSKHRRNSKNVTKSPKCIQNELPGTMGEPPELIERRVIPESD